VLVGNGRAALVQTYYGVYGVREWLQFDQPLRRNPDVGQRRRTTLIQAPRYRGVFNAARVPALFRAIDRLVEMPARQQWCKDGGVRIFGHITGVCLTRGDGHGPGDGSERRLSAHVAVSAFSPSELMKYCTDDVCGGGGDAGATEAVTSAPV